MTTETGLAVREYSDKQIRTRMELNKQAGYGLERASQANLNIIFLLCQRYDLDPVSDITLFEGRPFITIEGRLRLLRRHPEYRGFDCRPLKRDEKGDWGYEEDDIVVECTIRTSAWGEVKARGKVTAVEVQAARGKAQREGKRPAPIGVHPVEIAEKRAIARAERAAFGQEAVLDEDEVDGTVRMVVQERDDPAKIAADSARYAEIFPPNYGEDTPNTEGSGSQLTVPAVVESAPADQPPAAGAPDTRERPMIAADSPMRAELWAEHRRLQNKASELGLSTRTLSNRVSDEEIASANRELMDGISMAEAAL